MVFAPNIKPYYVIHLCSFYIKCLCITMNLSLSNSYPNIRKKRYDKIMKRRKVHLLPVMYKVQTANKQS